jgi:hypothetical protein
MTKQRKILNDEYAGLWTFGQLAAAVLVAAVWLVDHLVPAQGVTFLAAPPKSFKSWLALDLCIAVLTGGLFLGRRTDAADDAVVVYVNAEGRPARLRSRVLKLLAGRDVDVREIAERLILIPSARLRLDAADDVNGLLQELGKIGKPIAAIVFDPLAQFHLADENSVKEMGPILRVLRRMSEEFETAVIVAHHATKVAKDGSWDPLRGTSSLRGFHDGLIIINPSTGNRPCRRLTTEMRDADPSSFMFCVEIDDEERVARVKVLDAQDVGAGGKANNEALCSEVVAVLRGLIDANLSAIGAKVRRSNRDTRAALDVLVERGVVERYEKSGRVRYRLRQKENTGGNQDE